LKRYGRRNIDDQMYHGGFSYSLKLPKEELINLLRCVKDGKYKMRKGHGMTYEGEIWVLYENR
jgi:hypothetical protein